MNSNKIKDLHAIEAYISNKLSKQRKKDIEQRLLSDASFMNLYKMMKNLPKAARKSHLKEKIDFLLRLEESIVEEDSPKIKTSSMGMSKQQILWATAAAISLILVALFWLRGPKEGQMLVDQYFVAMPSGQERLRSVMDHPVDNLQWQKATALYDIGSYAEAEEHLHEIVEESPNDTALVLLGICEVATGDYEIALETFGRLGSASSLNVVAKFYRALALVGTENYQLALPLIDEITALEFVDTAVMSALKSDLLVKLREPAR